MECRINPTMNTLSLLNLILRYRINSTINSMLKFKFDMECRISHRIILGPINCIDGSEDYHSLFLVQLDYVSVGVILL